MQTKAIRRCVGFLPETMPGRADRQVHIHHGYGPLSCLSSQHLLLLNRSVVVGMLPVSALRSALLKLKNLRVRQLKTCMAPCFECSAFQIKFAEHVRPRCSRMMHRTARRCLRTRKRLHCDKLIGNQRIRGSSRASFHSPGHSECTSPNSSGASDSIRPHGTSKHLHPHLMACR